VTLRAHLRAPRVGGATTPGRRRHLPTWPLLAALVGGLPRSGVVGDVPLHAVPRQQEVRRHYVPFTLPASTRTTFRYVVGIATLSTSSPLTRLAHPYANVRLRAMSQNLRSEHGLSS